MANRKGLGTSKKYATGTIHETATGTFMVLDRFADEDDDQNIPMLEFQWLSGEKEGTIDVNREMNMAASIHKFASSKGRPTIVTEPQRIEHNLPFMEMVQGIHEIVMDNKNNYLTIQDHMIHMSRQLEEQTNIIAILTKQIGEVIQRNELLIKQQETVNKLIEKI